MRLPIFSKTVSKIERILSIWFLNASLSVRIVSNVFRWVGKIESPAFLIAITTFFFNVSGSCSRLCSKINYEKLELCVGHKLLIVKSSSLNLVFYLKKLNINKRVHPKANSTLFYEVSILPRFIQTVSGAINLRRNLSMSFSIPGNSPFINFHVTSINFYFKPNKWGRSICSLSGLSVPTTSRSPKITTVKNPFFDSLKVHNELGKVWAQSTQS